MLAALDMGGFNITNAGTFSGTTLTFTGNITTTDGVLSVTIDDATTNNVTTAATLAHTTTGTPAAGIGTRLDFVAETAAANNEIGARIAAIATDVTAAAEDFALAFSTMDAGATAAERFRVSSEGYFGIGTASPAATLHIAGSVSAAAWGENGTGFRAAAATYTDTSSGNGATVAEAHVNTIGTPTIASTGTTVTVTDAATLYVKSRPAQGTNITVTNAWAAWFGGPVKIAAGTLNGLEITTSNAGNHIKVESTDAGATAGPSIVLDRFSASPAANDVLGELQLLGRSSTAVSRAYARIRALAKTVTNGSENGLLALRTMLSGTEADRLILGGGVYTPNATGGDKGIDTINALAFYTDGVAHENFVRKPGNETVTGSTALQADDDLLFAIAASEVYEFEFEIFYTTTAAGDFKFELDSTAASDPTVVTVSVDILAPGATARVSDMHSALNTTVSVTGGAGIGHIIIRGAIVNDSAVGNLRLLWAQNTSDAGNTTVRRGSNIRWALS